MSFQHWEVPHSGQSLSCATVLDAALLSSAHASLCRNCAWRSVLEFEAHLELEAHLPKECLKGSSLAHLKTTVLEFYLRDRSRMRRTSSRVSPRA